MNYFFSIIISLFWLLSAPSVYAENRSVKVVTFHYPPFINGDRSGLAEKLHIAAFEERGYEVIFEYFPHKRAAKIFIMTNEYFFNGPNEFKGADISPDVDFLGVGYIQMVLVCLKDRFPHLEKNVSIEDIKGLKIGCVRGDSISLFYESAGVNIDLANTIESNIHKLMAGRVDLISTIDLTAHELIHRLCKDRSSEFSILNIHKTLAGLSVKKNGPLKEAFQEYKLGFQAIKEKGIYMKINEEFYGKGLVPDSVLVKE